MSDRPTVARSLATCCALGILASAAPARADDYDWLGIVYVWAADISVDTRDVNVDERFDDILDKLEMAFQTHVEVQGDNLGGFIDFTFLGLGGNQSRQLADFNSDLDTTLMDVGLIWSPGAERLSGFEAFGGLRYIDMDFHLVVKPTPPGVPDFDLKVNDTFSDLLIGARYIAPLDDHWRLMVTGDVSGGDTDGTWTAGVFGSYLKGAHRFILGYRHLEVDVKANGTEADETMSGPIVAYGYQF